jgi:multiple sugar transport system permease protein
LTATTLSPRKTPHTGPVPARGRPSGGFSRRLQRNLTGYGFLIGAVICFALFSWYPMIREFILAGQHTRRGRTTWVGFDNLVRIWHDPAFWQAWRNTAYFTLLALVIGFAVPFFVAILLNEFRHAKAYLRILVYLPVMLPPVASVLLFKYFYNSDYGLFNAILHGLHLPTLRWLDSATTAMPSVVLAATWMNMGSATLVYLAALQGIPGELYEAAELDGASIWRRIWHVTIPQTRLILSLMLLLQIIATMQVFTEPFLLTGGNGPQNSTITVVNLVYQYAFNFNNYGSAASLGVLILLVLVVFSALYARLNRDQD